MTKYELNNSLNGVEIYFESIPDASIRDEIKAAGFRWNGSKKCWYATQTDERIELAKRIAAGESESQKTQPVAVPTQTTEVEPPMTRKYCYADSIENFLGTEKSAWKKEMRSAFKEESDLPLGQSQINAWSDCYDVLQRELAGDLTGFNIVFEYVLPYHDMAIPKYESLGLDYPLKGIPPLTKEQAIEARNVIVNAIKKARTI